MLRPSLKNCVKILREEKIITQYEQEELLKGIELNQEKDFDIVSIKLQRLAENACREGEHYGKKN